MKKIIILFFLLGVSTSQANSNREIDTQLNELNRITKGIHNFDRGMISITRKPSVRTSLRETHAMSFRLGTNGGN